MQRRRTTSTRLGVLTSLAAIALVTSACGGDPIRTPTADELPAPTFVAHPTDLADAPQLEALVIRDTAGLAPDVAPVQAVLLPDALALLATIDNPPSMITGISMYSDSVSFTFYENGVVGRSVYAFYRLPYLGSNETEPKLTISEPTFADDPEFPIDAIDPAVPDRIVRAVQERFPLTAISSIYLEPSRSSGFGLAWNVSVDDARGRLATIYADLDGSIIAVELD